MTLISSACPVAINAMINVAALEQNTYKGSTLGSLSTDIDLGNLLLFIKPRCLSAGYFQDVIRFVCHNMSRIYFSFTIIVKTRSKS